MSSETSATTSSVCHNCITDEYLAVEIREGGTLDNCRYCYGESNTIRLATLAGRLHEAVQEHFRLLRPEYSAYLRNRLKKEAPLPPGCYSARKVVNTLMGQNEALNNDLLAILRDTHDPQDNGSPLSQEWYGKKSFWRRQSPHSFSYMRMWRDFEEEVRSQARYFGPKSDTILEQFFGNLSEYQSRGGEPVTTTVSPGNSEGFIWRGRVAKSLKELEDILKSPSAQLGPPKSRWSTRIEPRGGRMNAPGVPVFYGASDLKTCIAEVRPPVGSYVVVAKFEILRPVELLDFEAVRRVYLGGSYFDPEYGARAGRAAFLKRLSTMIQQPIMPEDETSEYITTQVMAEFLANKSNPRLDGIVFGSSQATTKSSNIVLFNHARAVKPNKRLVTTDASIYVPPSVRKRRRRVWSKLPREGQDIEIRSRPKHVTHKAGDAEPDHSRVSEGVSEDPVLALIPDSLVVLDVWGIEYNYRTHAVTWVTDDSVVQPQQASP